MISLFRKILQKLIEDMPAGLVGTMIGSYLKSALGEKLILVVSNNSPFRDLIWVEQKNIKAVTVPLGTGYNGKFAFGKNHIAYLRHAIPDYISGFYRYFVPTGHLLH